LKTNDEQRPEQDSPGEDIEILEVIGLDEDSPAARPKRAREGAPVGPDAEVVLLDADGAEPHAGDDDRDRGPGSTPRAEAALDEAERLARLAADFEGLRRRVEREREAAERHAAARLIERLLPVLDNFERALGAEPAALGPAFRDGIALIFRQLLEELRREGLAAVDTVGEPFDPEVHEAVLTTRDPDLPPNTVVEELQRGYLLHERLLRPALVKVTLDPDFEDGGAGGRGEP
jgi:molecular chaperone GrpE